jgi:S-DNA-T family DNA segregation ATPase FtsK/SpoIIIE
LRLTLGAALPGTDTQVLADALLSYYDSRLCELTRRLELANPVLLGRVRQEALAAWTIAVLHDYLKFDVTGMTRFKAAYVSGAYRRPHAAAVQEVRQHQIVPYRPTTSRSRPASPAGQPGGPPGLGSGPPTAGEQASALRAFDVIVGRLRGTEPPARQIWLPPLGRPVSLGEILPDLAADPSAGLLARGWPRLGQLAAPIVIIDRPFEQRRDLLVADLSGAAGHMAVVGATQTGKNTVLRSLVAAWP